MVKSGGLKYMNFKKGIKLYFICMKMKLMKNKKYLQQKFSRKVLVSQTTADFTSRDSKSYVPFTCNFPMVMHFVPILHRCCRSKTSFYVFSYDKTSGAAVPEWISSWLSSWLVEQEDRGSIPGLAT